MGSGLGLDDAADALVDIARLLGVGLLDHYGLVVLLELDLPLLAWLGVGVGVGVGVRSGCPFGTGPPLLAWHVWQAVKQ